MELSLEEFIKNRREEVDSMPEGDEKEKSLRNLVELYKAHTDALKTAYANSLEMAKLDSSEVLERERMNQNKELEELKIANAKDLEMIRFNHELKLEQERGALEREAKRLERQSIGYTAVQCVFRTMEILTPIGLFFIANAIENENGYLNSMSKTVLTKLSLKR